MLSKIELEKILKETVLGLRKIYGDKLEAVILFGSYARGDFSQFSDIDIALLLDVKRGEEKAYRHELVSFSTELDLEYDVLTSFRSIPISEFEEWKDTLPFYANIEREGVRIGA